MSDPHHLPDHAVAAFASGPGTGAGAGAGAGDATPVAHLVALDFDGTLAPLVDDPTSSRMTTAARAAVERLATLGGPSRTRLAFVSGRDLADLARCAEPPDGSYLVGSHGAETGHVVAGHVESVPLDLDDTQSDALRTVVTTLNDAVAGHDGTWVQVKPSAAVLHTRTADPDETEIVEAAADAVAERLGLVAMHGKDVVEIAVVTTSKGEAVRRLRDVVRAETGAASVRVLYAGDDTTDEHAFEVLADDDLAVKVGPGPTVAAHRVADADALAAVLQQVADLLDR